MDYIWIILKRDIKSLLTPTGKSTVKQRFGLIAGGVLLVALAAGLGYGAFRLFDYLKASLSVMPDLRRAVEINLLNGAALFVLVLSLLMGIQTTYKTIYESDDVGFLLSQPVPVWSVFGAKFTVSYVTLLAMTGAYGLPVWIAFAYSRGLGAAFYLTTAAGFLVLLLACHALVTLLLLTAMRYLPGRKMKQLFIALSAIFGILIVFASQMLSAKMDYEDTAVMIEQLGTGQLSRMWYLPTTWMTNGILGTLPEFGIEPAGGWTLLLVTALGGAYLAMVLSSRWYLHGWSGRTEELGAGKSAKKRSRVRTTAAPANRLQGVYWSVLRKDLKTLWRDPVVWYTLVIGVIGLGFYAYNIGSAMSGAETAGGGTDLVIASAMMVVMPTLMGSITAAQTGGVSLSREGKSFWLVRSGPVNPRQLLLAKFTYALFPQVLFIASFAVFLEFTSLPHLPLWLGLPIGGFCALSLASLQMLLDVYFPDFTLKVELGSSTAGKGTGKILTSLFSSMGMVAVIAIILLLPMFLRSTFPEVPTMTVAYWSYGIITAMGIGLVSVLFGLGTRRLSKLLSDM